MFKIKDNMFVKLLCSIPIILIALYFIPFLGICLVLFRYYVYGKRRYYITPIVLLVIGFGLIIPQIITSIIQFLNFNSLELSYINGIVNSEIYFKVLEYSKLLITVGVIFLILSFIFRNVVSKLSDKVNSGIRNYLEKEEKKNYEIKKENDLKMREQKEKIKNTHVVICPYCGSDNVLNEKTGTCKFCRRQIENK